MSMSKITWAILPVSWFGLALDVSAQATKLTSPQKLMIDAQLQKTFKKIDANADGFLDPDELAHAFRGPKAKPAPPMYDDKGNINPAFYRARSKYPDMIYLAAMDKDDDGRISWDEYRAYGETYAATLLGRQQALQRAMLQAMRNRTRYMSRSANYNRHRGRGSYRNYSRGYHSAYNYQQQMMRQYQSMYAQAVRAQQNYMRQMTQMRRSMYARVGQLQHRANYYRRR